MYLWTIQDLAFSSSFFFRVSFKIFRVLKIDKGNLDCKIFKIFKSFIFTVRYHHVSYCISSAILPFINSISLLKYLIPHLRKYQSYYKILIHFFLVNEKIFKYKLLKVRFMTSI